jgi:hypothetical protein
MIVYPARGAPVQTKNLALLALSFFVPAPSDGIRRMKTWLYNFIKENYYYNSC